MSSVEKKRRSLLSISLSGVMMDLKLVKMGILSLWMMERVTKIKSMFSIKLVFLYLITLGKDIIHASLHMDKLDLEKVIP
jgi:hypothetical protein